MRERLNNDPKVQLVVLGLVGVVFAFILMTQVFGGGEAVEPASDPAATGTTDPAATGATDTAATDPAATGTAAPAPAATATPTAPAASTPAPATGASEALLPTKGLPSDVLVAYAKSEAVVLLVVDPKSKGSGRLEKYGRDLDSRKDTAVFVVPTKQVPKYSRITEGVSVTQTPAIVVVRPRKLNASAPTATVSYGIRSKRSFEQAIDDALYKGGPVPAYP